MPAQLNHDAVRSQSADGHVHFLGRDDGFPLESGVTVCHLGPSFRCVLMDGVLVVRVGVAALPYWWRSVTVRLERLPDGLVATAAENTRGDGPATVTSTVCASGS